MPSNVQSKVTSNCRKLLAEFIGTAILVFFGVGSVVFGFHALGAPGVALTFGLVLLALAYGIGPTAGCHVNPAVTLGVLLRKAITLDRPSPTGSCSCSAPSSARRCSS